MDPSCPRCGAHISEPSARFCPACGKALDPLAPASPPEPGAAAELLPPVDPAVAAAISGAACARHPGVMARDVCSRCGAFACASCLRPTPSGQVVCVACAERIDLGRWNVPWERRDELGLFKAYWDTARAAAFSPQIAFAGLEPRGRWWDAMSFAMVSTLLSAGVLVLFYGGVVGVAMTFAPHELAPQGGHGKLIELAVGIGVVALMLVLLPVSAIVRVYVGAGIDHLALRLLGGGGAGFDATLRTYCYSMAPAFCGLVPGCGIYAWEIWRIVLVSIGYQRIHRMAGARAVAAVLVPYVLCCGGYFALLFGVGVLGSLGK